MTGGVRPVSLANPHRQASEDAAGTDRQARSRTRTIPLKLVIVRDMWLTGFDAPAMHTMYVDKPMKGHGLMQAIARVNRVFRDKPAGLVVDYIGIAQNLKSALGVYSRGDRDQTGIDEAQAIRTLWRNTRSSAPCTARTPRAGSTTDRRSTPGATPQARLAIMAGAIDWMLTHQQEHCRHMRRPNDGKKRAHRRYAGRCCRTLPSLRIGRARAIEAQRDPRRGRILPGDPGGASEERTRRGEANRRRP